MANKPEITQRTVTRLSENDYAQLKRKLPPTVVTADTTPTQAAWLLGVAHVLELLKDGYVVQSMG